MEEIKTLEKTAASHEPFICNSCDGFNMQANLIVIVSPYLKFPAKSRAETQARFLLSVK